MIGKISCWIWASISLQNWDSNVETTFFSKNFLYHQTKCELRAFVWSIGNNMWPFFSLEIEEDEYSNFYYNLLDEDIEEDFDEDSYLERLKRYWQ